METTIAYWGYKGIMEKNMEATTVYWGFYGLQGLYGFLGQRLSGLSLQKDPFLSKGFGTPVETIISAKY